MDVLLGVGKNKHDPYNSATASILTQAGNNILLLIAVKRLLNRYRFLKAQRVVRRLFPHTFHAFNGVDLG